jgi:hypothetical protein
MPHRRLPWLVAPVAILALATGVFSLAADNGYGRVRTLKRCPKCSDVCVPEALPTLNCVLRSTGETIQTTFACCCCVEGGNHNSYFGPK